MYNTTRLTGLEPAHHKDTRFPGECVYHFRHNRYCVLVVEIIKLLKQSLRTSTISATTAILMPILRIELRSPVPQTVILPLY